MSEPNLSPTVIIGAGLVGASVGCALTKAGVSVHLIDAVLSLSLIHISEPTRPY